MKKDDIRIRVAAVNDAEKLLSIYRYYVENTAISFEYEVPTVKEFEQRIKNILSKFPYLIAEVNGEIAGYAYAAPFKGRAAYDWSVETTIYVDKDQKRSGIGNTLYTALQMILSLQNILNMNACIAYPKNENQFLKMDSILFHERMGFKRVGIFHECGYKFNQWYDMIWMEKLIGQHTNNQMKVKKFDDVRQLVKDKYYIF